MNYLTNYDKANDEDEIIERSINALSNETKIIIEKESSELISNKKNSYTSIRINLPLKVIEYRVEIKRNLNASNIGIISHQLRSTQSKYILITRFVSVPLAKKMKEMDIQFIDTAGNAYINEPPVFIFIQGNKISNEIKEDNEKSVFNITGLKILFALLCNKDLLNSSYREIANKADVSLGSVSNIFKELFIRGYLVNIGHHRIRFHQKEILFEKWTMFYGENLRQKNIIGRYTAQEHDFWKKRDLSPELGLWGGEVAANILTDYINPEIITIYTNKPVNEIVLKYKFHKRLDGKIEVRKKFWNFDEKSEKNNLVPIILIYADLMSTADSRNIETAEIIYKEYIERHLREN
jgi:hypothetical protein